MVDFFYGNRRGALLDNNGKWLKSRWLTLLVGFILFPLAFLKGNFFEALIALFVGMIVGFFVDLVGVGRLHLWIYPRQSFLGKEYFALVIPAWGVFGLAINLLWNWLGTSWFIPIAITILLFAFYEIPNLKIKSWDYTIPMKLVILGWPPLIVFFRALFLIFHSI